MNESEHEILVEKRNMAAEHMKPTEIVIYKYL